MSRRWLVLALVFLGIVISYIDRGNLGIAADTMMRDLRLSPELMGVLLSGFFWTYALCQIPAGMVVDRFGIRMVYASAFCLWCLASASIAFSRGPADILASRLALGVAESVGPLASLAFIRQNFSSKENGVPTSIYIAGQTIGPACGALLGTALLTSFGWRPMFLLTGLGALLWVPAWLAFAPRSNPAKFTKAVDPSARVPWGPVLQNPTFWAISACVFSFSYYWWFVMTWMPGYLTMARGLSTLSMGRIYSIPLFTMAVTNILTGLWADRLVAKGRDPFRVRIAFGAAGLIGASAVLLLNIAWAGAAVLPILGVSICSFGVASSNFWTIAQYASPSNLVGRIIGYLNTLSQLAGVAAPIVTGRTLGPHKNFHLAILLAGCAPLVGCALLLFAGRGVHRLKGQLQQVTDQHSGGVRS